MPYLSPGTNFAEVIHLKSFCMTVIQCNYIGEQNKNDWITLSHLCTWDPKTVQFALALFTYLDTGWCPNLSPLREQGSWIAHLPERFYKVEMEVGISWRWNPRSPPKQLLRGFSKSNWAKNYGRQREAKRNGHRLKSQKKEKKKKVNLWT